MKETELLRKYSDILAEAEIVAPELKYHPNMTPEEEQRYYKGLADQADKNTKNLTKERNWQVPKQQPPARGILRRRKNQDAYDRGEYRIQKGEDMLPRDSELRSKKPLWV